MHGPWWVQHEGNITVSVARGPKIYLLSYQNTLIPSPGYMQKRVHLNYIHILFRIGRKNIS